MAEEKPLRKMDEAFKELANTLTNSHEAQLEVGSFSRACTLVSPLFRCLGIAFKFAELDYVAKVDDLAEASKSITTLQAMMDQDIQANCVRIAGSHTRNLLRVKRGIDMVKVLFEHIIASDSISLNGAVGYRAWVLRISQASRQQAVGISTAFVYQYKANFMSAAQGR